MSETTLEDMLKRSTIVRPANIKPKNNVLGDWKEVFEAALKEKQEAQP